VSRIAAVVIALSPSLLLQQKYINSHPIIFPVYNFQRKTVQAASDIVGIIGKSSFQEVNGNDIMRRVTADQVRTLSEHFPEVEPGCLLNGTAPKRLQDVWDVSAAGQKHVSTKRWVY
jgi:hypothetical protein